MTAEGKPDVPDVLVIGAGPSGSIVAHTLAKQGFSVVCLEQGDWVRQSDYPTNFPEWELSAQQAWAHDPNLRNLPSDYPVNVRDSDMSPSMHSAVGGSSIKWGAQWPRLVPSDFRVKTVDGVANDWPISYQELAPFYTEVDWFLGVAGMGGNPAYPAGLEFPQPAHPLTKVGRRAARGMNALGWHWWPGTNCIPSIKTDHLAACVRYGVCAWGCPIGAKASFDLAYWPEALKAGARLITAARVQRLITADGLVSGAEWIGTDGDLHFQPAGITVLCANGIGTTRLLLLSTSSEYPDGLANESGLVGKNLMLHPNSSVMGIYDEEMESWKGALGELVSSHQFYETDLNRGFVRGAKLHAMPTPGVIQMGIDLHRYRDYDDLWGVKIHDAARSVGRGVLWASQADDLPEEHNRVTLDDTLTDSSGIPAVKIDYKISENTWRIIRYCIERMTEIHEASGVSDVIVKELWRDEPGHLLGTARMGDDPATSVVNKWGRAHEIPNLYIADGSVFVTGGSANPTATICALALRTARQIVAHARNQKAAK